MVGRHLSAWETLAARWNTKVDGSSQRFSSKHWVVTNLISSTGCTADRSGRMRQLKRRPLGLPLCVHVEKPDIKTHTLTLTFMHRLLTASPILPSHRISARSLAKYPRRWPDAPGISPPERPWRSLCSRTSGSWSGPDSATARCPTRSRTWTGRRWAARIVLLHPVSAGRARTPPSSPE